MFGNSLTILKRTAIESGNDKIWKLSAALAYYTIFSLPSMLIVIIGLCSIFYGRDAVQGHIFGEINQFVGPDAALQLEDILKKTSLHHDNFFATTIGFVVLLVSATGIFGEIQDSINSIWGLQTIPKKNMIKLVLNRLISFSMILVLGFILLVSLVLSTLLETFMDHLKQHFSHGLVNGVYVFDYALMLAVTATLFAFVFKGLPDARIKWNDIWIGSLFTSVLFITGKFIIGYYLSHNNIISTYGATGSLIVILLWVYYSSIILYFGAEFTQVYVRFKGRNIEPNKYSMWVEKNPVHPQITA